MEQYATTVSELAQKLADILAEKIGQKSIFFEETCLSSTCYLRMNRYPPCPMSSQMFGIMPHTDSDFLTVLHQDHIGGLQLVKDGKWIAVKPNPEALVINIGDLMQVILFVIIWIIALLVLSRVVTRDQTSQKNRLIIPSYLYYSCKISWV